MWNCLRIGAVLCESKTKINKNIHLYPKINNIDNPTRCTKHRIPAKSTKIKQFHWKCQSVNYKTQLYITKLQASSGQEISTNNTKISKVPKQLCNSMWKQMETENPEWKQKMYKNEQKIHKHTAIQREPDQTAYYRIRIVHEHRFRSLPPEARGLRAWGLEGRGTQSAGVSLELLLEGSLSEFV